MARVKPVMIVQSISTLDEADAVLARIAARKRELTLKEIALKEDVDALKLKCGQDCEPIKQDIEAMEQALIRFSESKKTEIFARKKSIALTFGTLGFRASTAVKPMKKTTWEQVLGILKQTKDSALAACIRIKQEVDKDALRQLPPEKLAEAGCRLEDRDTFFYEIVETELAPENAQ